MISKASILLILALMALVMPASAIEVIASDELKTGGASGYTYSTSYTKLGELTLNSDLNGSMRIKAILRTSTAGSGIYDLRVNGVSTGLWNPSHIGNYDATYEFNWSFGSLQAGDKIQLYGRTLIPDENVYLNGLYLYWTDLSALANDKSGNLSGGSYDNPMTSFAVEEFREPSWDDITGRHVLKLCKPVPTNNWDRNTIPGMTECSDTYTFNLSKYDLDNYPSGGNSSRISPSEMVILYVKFDDYYNYGNVYIKFYNLDTDKLLYSSMGTMPRCGGNCNWAYWWWQSYAFIGRFSHEIATPGNYQAVVESPMGSAGFNFTVISGQPVPTPAPSLGTTDLYINKTSYNATEYGTITYNSQSTSSMYTFAIEISRDGQVVDRFNGLQRTGSMTYQYKQAGSYNIKWIKTVYGIGIDIVIRELTLTVKTIPVAIPDDKYSVTASLNYDTWEFTACAGNEASILRIQSLDGSVVYDYIDVSPGYCIARSVSNDMLKSGYIGMWQAGLYDGEILKAYKNFEVKTITPITYTGKLTTEVSYIGSDLDYVGCQDVFPDNNTDSLFKLTVSSQNVINLTSVSMQLIDNAGNPSNNIVYSSLDNDYCAMGVYRSDDTLINGANIARTFDSPIHGINEYHIRTTLDRILKNNDRFLVTSKFDTGNVSYAYVNISKLGSDPALPTPSTPTGSNPIADSANGFWDILDGFIVSLGDGARILISFFIIGGFAWMGRGNKHQNDMSIPLAIIGFIAVSAIGLLPFIWAVLGVLLIAMALYFGGQRNASK